MIKEQMYKEELELLKNNQELKKKIKEYLIEKGYKSNLKGFIYFCDIATIGLLKKKYSKTFLKEIYPFIAYKYKIKEFSVQRQLRYTFTLSNEKLKIKPEDLYQELWFEYKTGQLLKEDLKCQESK